MDMWKSLANLLPKINTQNHDNHESNILKLRKKYDGELKNQICTAERLGSIAQAAEDKMKNCRKTCEQKREDFQKLNSHLSALPAILTSVDETVRGLANIYALAEEVEESLKELEDVVEEQEMERRILDTKVQFILHRERRSRELEDLKDRLRFEHEAKVREFEHRQSEVLKEKQKKFDEAFRKDVSDFVARGKLPEKTKCPVQVRLEDVTIEDDPFSLEDFLNDMTLNGGDR